MRILVSLMVSMFIVTGCTQEASTPTEGGTTTATGSNTAATGATTITATTAPFSAEKGVSDALLVEVTQNGQPVENAKVTAKSSMPGMNMNGPDLQGTQTAPGKYRLPGDLMKGEWQFDIKVELPNGSVQTEIVKAEVK
jgi:nitrogen fixation protein FixH